MSDSVRSQERIEVTKVWIDTHECMGAGTCAEIAPAVFHQRTDGTWAVKEDATFFGDTTVFDGVDGPGHGPDGYNGRARIPVALMEHVIEAAEECPAECIHMELER
jgi:ferredoxin